MDDIPLDYVPALVANAAHPAIEDYLKRPRGEWPPIEQLNEVQHMPMCLVLVGSKESHNPDLQARNSWSTGEMLLISKLPKIIKKGLIAAKCLFKHCVKFYRDGNVSGDGRSHVGSYHLKTTLLNHLEKTPPSKFNSPFNVMLTVFQILCIYIQKGYLPHYFLPECNLLATVGCEARQIALNAIQHIVCDPIATTLKCPSKPHEIYGDISPDDLVAAFQFVSTHPSCERSWDDLLQLLSRLDRWRPRLYHVDLQADERYGVSGRPELITLVDMLEKILAPTASTSDADPLLEAFSTSDGFDPDDSPTLKDLMQLMMKNHNENHTHFSKIQNKLDELEKSLDFVTQKFMDKESEIQNLQSENATLRQELLLLAHEMATLKQDQKALQSRQELAQR